MNLNFTKAQWNDTEKTSFTLEIQDLDKEFLNGEIFPFTHIIGNNDSEIAIEVEKAYKDLDIADIADFVQVLPTDEEVKNAVVVAVQELLDSVAQSRGYDNGFACASYYNSSVNTFRNEAHAYVEWRDKVWQTCYALLDSYLAGDIPRPTVEDVMSKLPVISWVTDYMAEEKQKQEETTEQA